MFCCHSFHMSSSQAQKRRGHQNKRSTASHGPDSARRIKLKNDCAQIQLLTYLKDISLYK